MDWGLSRLGPLALAANLIATPAAAAPPLTLAPSTPWNVHYADDSCMLIRVFGEGKKRLVTRFEQTAPGRRFSLTLVGEPVESPGPFTRAALTFLPVGKRDARERVASGTTSDTKQPLLIAESIYLLGPIEKAEELEAYDWTKAGEVDSLLIERGSKDILLQLGRMQKPLQAMTACTDELLTHWGLDAAAQRTLQRLPQPLSKPQSWLNWSDYPRGALEKGKSAIVRFRLTVDADGKVRSCAIPSATQGPEFADITCKAIARRARFEPALDKDGKPVASYYVSTVVWVAG
ncbi:MAG: energy transducer TonB [Novosphingobium sp.]|nr:energy transducer TonB [Novosphingobium sp.]